MRISCEAKRRAAGGWPLPLLCVAWMEALVTFDLGAEAADAFWLAAIVAMLGRGVPLAVSVADADGRGPMDCFCGDPATSCMRSLTRSMLFA